MVGMSARDRYSIALKCSYCGSQGSADLSENDHPYAPPETRLDAIHGGFRLLPGFRDRFACTLCGVEAQ